jgi:hypothetical protein
MPAKTSKAPAKAKKATSSPAKSKKAAAPAAKKAPAPAVKSVAKAKASSAKGVKPAAPAKAAKPKSRSAAKPAAAPKPAPESVITRDMIATRAYFIGERRQRMGWAGDSSTDWIEAESQVIAEAKRKRKS